MPFATFTRVREVSSEDEHHLAEHLIKPVQGKKWKTKSPGEKSAYVILEMEGAQQITGIDIGNEHSAFIEVLVGKSSSAPGDFTEILITCSFMTPIESRNSNNTNRVRCFNKEALVPSVADKKWTLVKIICTQPFNKHIQYGLSFIKVHIAQSRPSTSAASEGSTINKKTELPESDKSISLHIGKFKLREDSPDSENDGACSLFSRWKNRKDDKVEETPTPAASIRKANIESICHNRSVVEKPKRNLSTENKQTEVRDRNRNDLLFGDDSVVESEREVRLAKEIEADKERRRLELQKREEAKQKDKRKSVDKNSQRRHNDKENDTNKVKTALNLSAQSTSKNDNSFSEKSKREITKKRPNSPNERPSKKPRGTDIKLRPFNQLLKGVVLVISGIQNPDRANLRTKAIALGAIYKADWDTTCTHLICAFKNTPKYNQVKGKGKIITRSWVEKCYESKKYLPWRRFALDSEELSKPESDEEILDESSFRSNDENARRESEDRNETLALYDLEENATKVSVNKNQFESSSESDTDDEIQRLEEKRTSIDKIKQKTYDEKQCMNGSLTEVKLASKTSGDIYDASTDEEEYLQYKLKPQVV